MAPEDWSKARWFVVFPGLADAWLWGFDVEGKWRLRHGSPARSALAMLPMDDDGPLATLEDTVWLADCLAFDHDAPVGVRPTSTNPDARFPYNPVHPLPGDDTAFWYFDNLLGAFSAAAEARFGDSYCLRYNDEVGSPATDFSQRFAGREQHVTLYAMATRQADVLTEYLCLYRVLEAADGGKGVTFVSQELDSALSRDFGVLRVIPQLRHDEWTNAFEVYRGRASLKLQQLRSAGAMSDEDIANYLYALRNSLAHGKRGPRVSDFGTSAEEAASALSIVKLLARIAVEP